MKTKTLKLGAAPGAEVEIRYPTERERRRLINVLVEGLGDLELGADGKPQIDPDSGEPLRKVAFEALEEHRRLACVGHVDRVAGLSDRFGDAITTGAELFEHGDQAVLLEVVGEVVRAGVLTEQEKKTSDGPTASAQTPTGRRGGTAATAAPAATRSSGVASLAAAQRS